MPRVPFAEENKVATTNYEYPKLKLKTGERARILVGLEDPQYEYVHNLRKPVIINGEPAMETKERKDGSTYQVNKLAFISNPLCLGRFETVKESGSDPKNCPACAFAKEYPDYMQPPKRRFAMHVIRYRTKSGSFDVAEPFSVELLVWAFSDYHYGIITDHQREWGDLRTHDLLLGPCSNEGFQKFDINVSKSAEWTTDAARKQLVVETFKNNQIPDLTIAIGNVKQRAWIEQDLEMIKEEWAKVHAANRGSDIEADFGNDLNKLLEKKPAAAAAEAPEDPFIIEGGDVIDGDGVVVSEADDLLGDLDSFSPVAEPVAEPVSVTAGAAPKDEKLVDNFDDLLGDL